MDWKQNLTDKVRNLGENIGGVARNVGENIGDVARNVGENIGDMARNVGDNINDKLESNKLKGQISNLEKEMNNNFASIGILYYQKITAGNPTDPEIDRLCRSITSMKKEISDLQEKMASLKDED